MKPGRHGGKALPLVWLLLAGAAPAMAAGDPPAVAAVDRGADAAPSAPAPIREFTDAQGRPCRLYARHVLIAGDSETAYATVCRDSNGRWVLSR